MDAWTWVEPFAGAAACALRIVGGRQLVPPVAWMGGKRRLARAIHDAMGVPDGRPRRVVLADAGAWGWVWPLLLDAASSARVAVVLRSWQGEHPRDLWDRLVAVPPAEDVHERAAQWLWLQARSASGVPIWWSSWRWAASDHLVGWEQGSGEGRPAQPAGQRGEWRMGEEVSKSKRGDRTIAQTGGSWRFAGRPDRVQESRAAGCSGDKSSRPGGLVNPSTIADRIDAISLAFRDVHAEVHHGDAAGLAPHPGFVYLDPPYVGATGYGWNCLRAEVLRLAQVWADAGAVVAVSEAEPLALDGWHHLELTQPGGKPEWLTLSREPVHVPSKQLDLCFPESP